MKKFLYVLLLSLLLIKPTYSLTIRHTHDQVLNRASTVNFNVVSANAFMGGMGVTGNGQAGQVTFWNTSSSITGNQIFLFDTTNGLGLLAAATITGNVLPGADDTYNLGSSTARWAELFVASGSIHIGTDGNDADITFDTVENTLKINTKTAFGTNNAATGLSSGVGGGQGNTASGESSYVGGGTENIASGFRSTVVGGDRNTSSGINSFVGAGALNIANGDHSSVGGGNTNIASGDDSFVGGGRQNTASSLHATVVGGLNNTAAGNRSTIPGGLSNVASGNVSFVGGGNANIASGFRSTVVGGITNTAAGIDSTIPGGISNVASGDVSFAAGRQAIAANNGVFVWADDRAEDFISQETNTFIVRALNGIGLNTNHASTFDVQVSGNIGPQTNDTFSLGNDAFRWGDLFIGSLIGKRTQSAISIGSTGELIIGITDTLAERTVTINSSEISDDGRLFIIKDESGGAGVTGNIIVVTEGAETIDGAASSNITVSFGSVRLYSNGSNLFSW